MTVTLMPTAGDKIVPAKPVIGVLMSSFTNEIVKRLPPNSYYFHELDTTLKIYLPLNRLVAFKKFGLDFNIPFTDPDELPASTVGALRRMRRQTNIPNDLVTNVKPYAKFKFSSYFDTYQPLYASNIRLDCLVIELDADLNYDNIPSSVCEPLVKYFTEFAQKINVTRLY